jgi:hypothetical protein
MAAREGSMQAPHRGDGLRFPYAIIYWAEGIDVRVLAVADLKRRPFYWSERA